MTASDFRKALSTGEIVIGRKGKLSVGKLSNEYKALLDKEKSAEKPKNKKIMGATKCIYKDIKFDSKLELNFYRYLELQGIDFIHQQKYVIQEGFRFEGKKIQEITWTPDFYFPDKQVIVDTKGFATEVFRIKQKLFLFKYRIPVHIFKTSKDFNKINEILK